MRRLAYKNGTRPSQQGLKQVYLCKKCRCQIAVPTKSMLKKITAEDDASSNESTNPQEKQAVEESVKKKEERQSSLDAYHIDTTKINFLTISLHRARIVASVTRVFFAYLSLDYIIYSGGN